MIKAYVFFCLLSRISTTATTLDVDSCTGTVIFDRVASVVIQTNTPSYAVHTLERKSEQESILGYCVYITISSEAFSQTLHCPWIPFSMGDLSRINPAIEFLDMNGDSCLDIHLRQGITPEGLDADNLFWLWNTQARQFEFNTDLSSLFSEAVSISEGTQEFEIGVQGGCGGLCYSSETYQFINDALTLTIIESNEQIDNDVFVYTKKQLVDGRMTIVAQDTSKWK